MVVDQSWLVMLADDSTMNGKQPVGHMLTAMIEDDSRTTSYVKKRHLNLNTLLEIFHGVYSSCMQW